MSTPLQSKADVPGSLYNYSGLFEVNMPPPALQREWLHGRELTQPWHVERIAAAIGEGGWFS